MERDTLEITIGDHKFVVKTYATAREYQAIQRALTKDAKFEVIGDSPRLNDFDPSVMFSMQEEMIRQMVVSFDGNTENVPARALELPNGEFEELVEKLDELVSKKKK